MEANVLFRHVARTAPAVHQRLLHLLQPHSLDALLPLLQKHLEHAVPDLDVFNRHPDRIPTFLLYFVSAIRKRFPLPGDAFGIQLTCRVTKADTQCTLDSKHLRAHGLTPTFCVDKALQYELYLFTNPTHVFEVATRRDYSTVFTRGCDNLLLRLGPNACLLERDLPYNKGRDVDGRLQPLSGFHYLVVPDGRVLYKSHKHLGLMLRRLHPRHLVGFSDLRTVFQKCGLVANFVNTVQVVRRQLGGSKDVLTIVKYQCRTGTPLPLTRDGLMKNPERTPIEVLSFEAPKKNLARLSTTLPGAHEVKSSADKIFFGQQFNEGTGYRFEVRPKRYSSTL